MARGKDDMPASVESGAKQFKLGPNEACERSPKCAGLVGASWEGFAIEQILNILRVREAYFWRTHQGAELDLLVMHKGKRYGFEMKMGDAPAATKSMRMAIDDLGLHRLSIVYPGRQSYILDDKIQVVAIQDLAERLVTLK